MPLFAAKNLSYSIEGRTVINDLTVSAAGRRVGIVGRNGSGKSTLVRLLAGLIAPQQGSLHICGIDPAKDRRMALRTVGVLFQNPDHQIIFPTVEEELAFGLTQMGKNSADVEKIIASTLQRFSVSHWRGRYVNQLSHGQKHLLCLMAVTAMSPRVLLLDEPFAGLDIPTRAQLVRALSVYEGAIVHVSHDPRDLAGYDAAVWIEKGQITAEGPASEVLTNYAAQMTAWSDADDLTQLTG